MAGTLDTSQTTLSLTWDSVACASISLRKIWPCCGMIKGNCDSSSKRTPLRPPRVRAGPIRHRSEEHTSELQSPCNLVCRLLLEKKKIRDALLNATADGHFEAAHEDSAPV